MTFVNNSKTPYSLSAANFGQLKQADGDKPLKQPIQYSSKTLHSLSAASFGQLKQANGDKPLRQLIRSLRQAKELGPIIDPQDPNYDQLPGSLEYSSNFSKTVKGVVGPNHPGDLYKVTIEPSSRSFNQSLDSLELTTKGRGKGVNVLSFTLDNGFFIPNTPLAASNTAPLSVGNRRIGSGGFLAGIDAYAYDDRNLGNPTNIFNLDENSDSPRPVTVYIQVTPVKGRNSYTLTVNSKRDSDPVDKQPIVKDDSLDLFERSLTNTRILGRVGLKNKPKSLGRFNNIEAQTTPPQSYKLTVNPGVDREGSITINNLATIDGGIDRSDLPKTIISTASFITNNGFITSFSPYSVEAERSSYLPGSFYNFTDQPTNYYIQIRPAALSYNVSLPYNMSLPYNISADLFN